MTGEVPFDDMRSTSGYCFAFGSSIFLWSSKKQETVAQSTVEAEFVAAIAAVNHASSFMAEEDFNGSQSGAERKH